MHDVELGRVQVRGEGVVGLDPRVPEERGIGRLVRRRNEPCLRPGTAAREERHVVAALDDVVTEEADDEFDPAVAAWRYGKPDWGDLRDAHG